ncbi:glycerate kinase [Opitutaceae bacterium EW11]|nr:glycerate kinase [Opitutaceae bacterium EW11]
MRVLVAFDKFKHAISAGQACGAARLALKKTRRDWELDLCPLTDGGDGFESILADALRAERIPVSVTGPRGGLVSASVSLVRLAQLPPAVRSIIDPPSRSEGTLAIVEMARASGLALLPPELRNPWETTTYGTGQLLRAAAEMGASAILLGIGGSATNDLGLGALNALGIEFRTSSGSKVRPPTPALWQTIASIEGDVFEALPPVLIATDVTNPLLGPEGCSAVFGPQKGLSASDVARMEESAESMARALCAYFRLSSDQTRSPGAGAAGGLAFGLLCTKRARIVPGFDVVADSLDLDRRIAAADVVITGEGRFDASSLGGKGPGSLAARALAANKPVHVFAGQVSVGPRQGLQLHALSRPDALPSSETLARTAEDLRSCVEHVFG